MTRGALLSIVGSLVPRANFVAPATTLEAIVVA